MRSNTSGGNLTCVGLFPSGGRPIRDGVVDTDMSDKGIENDTVFVDAINDAVYINGIVYGGKAMAIKDADLYSLGMNTDMISGFRDQMARKHKGLALWPEHLTGKRWWDWQEGRKIAVNYKLLQLKIGCMVRSDRNRDFATTGATSRLVARGKERRGQQLRNLRILTGHLRAPTDTTHDR